jgi:hypothetical protein
MHKLFLLCLIMLVLAAPCLAGDRDDRRNSEWMEPRRGDVFVSSPGGAVNTRTGEHYPQSGPGVVDPRTGDYLPDVKSGTHNQRDFPSMSTQED